MTKLYWNNLAYNAVKSGIIIPSLREHRLQSKDKRVHFSQKFTDQNT